MPQGDMDLSGIIQKLMNSSETAEMIEKLKASVENSSSGAQAEPVSTKKIESEEISSATTQVPQLSEKLPQVMAALSPLIENGTLGKTQLSRTSEYRNNLLSALRPYLNEGRQSMIDSIMTLSKFTGIMDLLPRDK